MHDHHHGDDHDAEHYHDPEAMFEALMEDAKTPMGPEDAPVLVETVFDDPTLVEDLLRPMFAGVASGYPGHVRFEFVPHDSEEGQQLVETVTTGRTSALAINGEMIKMVPTAPLGMLAFGGSPAFEEWSEHDLRMAIEWELEQAGVEFESRLGAPATQIPPPGGDDHGHGHVHGPDCDH